MKNQLSLTPSKRLNIKSNYLVKTSLIAFTLFFFISGILNAGTPPLPAGAPPLEMPLPPTVIVGQPFDFPGFDINFGTPCTAGLSTNCNPFFGAFAVPGQLWQIGICRDAQGNWFGSDIVIVRDDINLFDAFTFQLCGNFEFPPNARRTFVLFGANPWGQTPGIALELNVVPGSDPITPIINTTSPLWDGAAEASYAFDVVITDDQGIVIDVWDPVIIISDTLQPNGDVNNCPPDCGINSVPTLSQWGIFLLVLLLFTISVAAIVRQQSLTAQANAGSALLTSKPRIPLFEPSLFWKILPKVMVFAPVVLIVFYLLYGFITIPDVFGTLITAGVVAWLVHYILLSNKKD